MSTSSSITEAGGRLVPTREAEMNPESPPVIRDAGLLERYHVTRQVLGMDSCVIVAATYSSNAGVLDKPTLFSALAKVVQRHAALSMQIYRGATRHPVFVRLPEIDLSKVVAFNGGDHDSLQDTMEAHLLRRFKTDTTSPLWRLEVFEDNTVLFAFLHAIADGQSGRAFHQALLTALNEVTSSPTSATPDIVSVSKDLMPVQTVETLTDVSVPFLTVCSAILDLFIPVSWKARASAWSGEPVARTITLVTSVRLLSLSPDEAGRLLALCRTHKATLTAFFHTLTILVLSGLIAKDPLLAQKYSTISTQIPVSLRRFCGVSADELCVSASAYEGLYPLLDRAPQSLSSSADEFPWDVASSLTTKLHANLAKTRELVGLLKFLFGNIEGWVKGKQGSKRGHGIELSNIGPFPAPTSLSAEGPTQAWSIESMQFVQPCHNFGAAFKIGLIGTPLGGLGISIVWEEDSVGAAFAEAFVARFREGLKGHVAKQ